MDAVRRSKRYAADAPLLLRCESWADFVGLYAADIGQGGMFIVTDEPPALMSVIDIRMQLPEATDIALRARVVHVVEPEQAGEGRPAGVGVEFVELDAERKRQIFHLIEFARWQGDNPNASLHKTMAELSRSVPPQAVGSALPKPTESTPVSPRKTTLDGTERSRRTGSTTLDGTDKTRRTGTTLDGTDKRANETRTPRKTLDGTDKPSAPNRVASGPISTPTKPRSDHPAQTSGTGSDKPVSMQPADPVKIKAIMTHFAHKRYEMALKELAPLLANNPNDPQALKWQAMCKARQALATNDDATAAQQYAKALEYDEGIREARDFVRSHSRDQKLSSLPFGRYFVKKK